MLVLFKGTEEGGLGFASRLAVLLVNGPQVPVDGYLYSSPAGTDPSPCPVHPIFLVVLGRLVSGLLTTTPKRPVRGSSNQRLPSELIWEIWRNSEWVM
jgi:hypothetical protein